MASGYSDLSEIRKDGNSYNVYPKPPKINLINEQPRRESVIEQQLNSIINRPNYQQPSISQLPPQQQYPYPFQPYQQHQLELQQQQQYYQPKQQVSSSINKNFQQDVIPRSHEFSAQEFSSPYNHQGTSTNYTTIRQPLKYQSNYGYPHDPMAPGPSGIGNGSRDGYSSSFQQQNYQGPSSNYTTVTKTVKTTTLASENLGRHQQQMEQQPQPQYTPVAPVRSTGSTSANYADLAAELAEKEAKLKREIAYMNLHQNQWSRPRQTREPRREPQPKVVRSEQRWVKDCTSGSPSSRPTSRASSNRSTTEADLLEKANKLLQDVEELERKPLNKQQILIESGASRANPSTSQNQQEQVSSIHTAIIKVPNYEIDNKSPLPFAFDNFSTLGVRGNIASFGAAPPETPYPPIFPTIKRTPSPSVKRG